MDAGIDVGEGCCVGARGELVPVIQAQLLFLTVGSSILHLPNFNLASI
jgi:hypothetical protein